MSPSLAQQFSPGAGFVNSVYLLTNNFRNIPLQSDYLSPQAMEGLANQIEKELVNGDYRRETQITISNIVF